jgi:hypothetical protein
MGKNILSIYYIFSFIMLNFYFYNIFILVPFIFYFLFLIFFFFSCNNFYYREFTQKTVILKNQKILKKTNIFFFLFWFFLLNLNIYIYIYFIKFDFQNFWFNHLKITNYSLLIIYNIINIFFVYFYIISVCKNNSNFNKINFYFAINNLIIFILFMFLANTFYTFFFTMEITSLLILYKFSTSGNIFKKNNFFKNNLIFKTNSSKFYLNMIFYQYWINFFSSIFLLFFLLSIMYIYGSSEWVLINLLCFFSINNAFLTNFWFFLILWFFFFIGFFLKLGSAPMHFFKVEVYKGLNLISIFFYTTVYFLSFFLFFSQLVLIYLNTFKFLFFIFYYLLFFLSFISLFFLLFNIVFFKNFFVYSTIVNIFLFFSILILSI